MKRLTVVAMLVLAMVCAVGAICAAADFSGKWIAFKMDITQGEENQVLDLDVFEMPEDQRARLEFKDGKAYFMENAEATSDEGMECKAEGDKLIAILPDDVKAEGLQSVEYAFDGDALVMTMVQDSATMKFIFRKQ